MNKFITSRGIGGIGESIFYSLFSQIGNVSTVIKDGKWQKKGVDFIVDGVFYDTKFDTKAFSTGNVALETVSRRKDGKIIKSGWALSSGADCIAYVFLEGLFWSMYLFTPEEIKDFLSENNNYRRSSVCNYGYESEIVLLPLSDIEHKTKTSIPVAGGSVDLSGLIEFHQSKVKEKE